VPRKDTVEIIKHFCQGSIFRFSTVEGEAWKLNPEKCRINNTELDCLCETENKNSNLIERSTMAFCVVCLVSYCKDYRIHPQKAAGFKQRRLLCAKIHGVVSLQTQQCATKSPDTDRLAKLAAVSAPPAPTAYLTHRSVRAVKARTCAQNSRQCDIKQWSHDVAIVISKQ
jgi:hypothetical protein